MGQSALSGPVQPPGQPQMPPDLHSHSPPNHVQMQQPSPNQATSAGPSQSGAGVAGGGSGGGGSGGGSGSGPPGGHQQCGSYISGTSNLDSKKCTRGTLSGASRPLSTLKKRLIRGKRRSSKNYDHAQVFRDFVRSSAWTARELSALVREYECLAALRELEQLADAARPAANSCRKDLAALFESKLCADITLIYRGSSFPAHRAVLCVRCPFFRELLSDPVTLGSQIVVEIDIPGVTLQLFNDLIRYLYTGELCVSHSGSLGTLLKLSEQFGIPNPLEQDLRFLLESELFCDALLVFSNNNQNTAASTNLRHCSQGGSGSDFCKWCSSSAEFACHKALLAARSRFLKAAILRQQRREGVLLQRSVKITLDRSVVPVKYSKVILWSIYQDNVDFASLLPADSLLQDLMEIYQISRLLEIDSLTQNCEDVIAELLTVDNVVSVINWSQQAHASSWVRRQALNFLKEEFALVACAPYVLCQLSADILGQVLDSDFTQASELEILSALVKWAENRSLNVTNETGEFKRNTNERSGKDSSSRSTGKRSASLDLLRDTAFCEDSPDTVSKLMSKVRFAHILPKGENEVLQMCAQRGWLPPAQAAEMLKAQSSANTTQVSQRTSGAADWSTQRPRLFLSYFEEAKSMLEALGHVCVTPCSTLPYSTGNAYMATNPYVTRSEENIVDSLSRREHDISFLYDFARPPLSRESSEGDSKSPGGNDEALMVSPSEEMLHQMRQRETELWSGPGACKALALAPAKRSLVSCLVRLRVVREMGFPDETAQALKSFITKGSASGNVGATTTPIVTSSQPTYTTLPHQASSCKSHHQAVLSIADASQVHQGSPHILPSVQQVERIRSSRGLRNPHSIGVGVVGSGGLNSVGVSSLGQHVSTLPRELRLLSTQPTSDHFSSGHTQSSLANLLASQANLSDLNDLTSLSCSSPSTQSQQAKNSSHGHNHLQSVHYSLARRKQRLANPQFLLRGGVGVGGDQDGLHGASSGNLMPWATHIGLEGVHSSPSASFSSRSATMHPSLQHSNRRLLSTFGGGEYGYVCKHSDRERGTYREHLQNQG